jgi:hypothetical protein
MHTLPQIDPKSVLWFNLGLTVHGRSELFRRLCVSISPSVLRNPATKDPSGLPAFPVCTAPRTMRRLRRDVGLILICPGVRRSPFRRVASTSLRFSTLKLTV